MVTHGFQFSLIRLRVCQRMFLNVCSTFSFSLSLACIPEKVPFQGLVTLSYIFHYDNSMLVSLWYREGGILCSFWFNLNLGTVLVSITDVAFSVLWPSPLPSCSGTITYSCLCPKTKGSFSIPFSQQQWVFTSVLFSPMCFRLLFSVDNSKKNLSGILCLSYSHCSRDTFVGILPVFLCEYPIRSVEKSL